jgi:hypothetical protein
VVGVNYAVLGIGSHPAAAHEVGVAIDRQDVLRPRRLEDLPKRPLGELDVLAVVLALGVVHPSHRDPVPVRDVGEHGDPVLG